MATLVKPRISERASPAAVDLTLSIPKPYPTQAEREREELLETLASEQLQFDAAEVQQETSTPIIRAPVETEDPFVEAELLRGHEELLPTIDNLQTSCLTTLNDLLATTGGWQPILPDRRRSMPPPSPSGLATSSNPAVASSALLTLVRNLRNHASESMTETASDTDENGLLHELQSRVDQRATTLSAQNASLAKNLVSLLRHFSRLGTLYPGTLGTTSPRVASWTAASSPQSAGAGDAFSRLRRQLHDLQLERSALGETLSPVPESVSSVRAVETALLWSQIDTELETVLSFCRSTSESTAADHLPPGYDLAEYEDNFANIDNLPRYEANGYDTASLKSAKERPHERTSQHLTSADEKMRMDLEAITLAIDRLYHVAPQLHDQRAELRLPKPQSQPQAESSRRAGKQKQKEEVPDVRELEKMVELIGRATDRRMNDQVVELKGGMKARMKMAQQRDLQKRQEFVEHLMEHSGHGRMSAQDAEFQRTTLPRSISTPDTTTLEHDPHTMLSLPEFMQEDVPDLVGKRMRLQELDPEAMLSLPEFVKEPVPERMVRTSRHSRILSQSTSHQEGIAGLKSPENSPLSPKPSKPLKSARSRSLSAPPLAWLLSTSSSRSASPTISEAKKPKSGKSSRPTSSHGRAASIQILDVSYVAEFHENLQHVLVFLTVTGVKAGSELQAEVPEGRQSQLLLKYGSSQSPPIELPTPVSPGKKEVRVAGDMHYEIKLSTSPPNPSDIESYTGAVLDGTHLSNLQPTSLICSSCSLPLVQASKLKTYRDLPSEHWEELVEAWMCHTDLNLNEHVKKNAKEGFWPSEGEVLVGGSYVLLREETVIKSNLCEVELDFKHPDDWLRVRCICGAVLGRCQEHKPKDSAPAMVYRLAKYAFRPVSPSMEPSKIPLSAFIVEDMQEYVHAHATYRFVVMDEEEERPRILIWLFKPNIRLSYTTPSQFIIPKTGTIRGSKILFQLLGPNTSTIELQTLLHKYPGFPQAEHLYYPIDICRRLAGLLKESNTAYPESMRTMTGLSVGWLQRA